VLQINLPRHGPADNCAGNAEGAVAAAMLMHALCEDPCEQKDNLGCDIANAAIAAAAGCLQGLFVGGLPEGVMTDVTDAVFSLFGGAVGAELDQCPKKPGG